MNNDIVPRDESRECIPGLLAPSEWVGPRLIVLDLGRRVSFHIADALRYHGLESVGGVILGFRLAQRALDEGRTEDVAYFEPFYLKDFVITVSKKKIF